MTRKVIMILTILTFLISMDLSPNNIEMQKGVSIYQLDNGLKVLMIENRALPMIGVNVVVRTGSAYETFSTSGMSHMLEHLLFNGTKSRTQKMLYDETDLIGGYNNANTSEYYTNYMMVTPAENIEKGMDIQADMLFKSVLPQKKFEKEKGIVLEEISKSIVKPTVQKERNISSILFKGHSLSLPTLGTFSTIKNLKRDDVFTYYKNRYVPNNMTMSVIGNFKSADMLKMIEKIYGSAAPGIIKSKTLNNFHTGFEKLPGDADPDQIYHRFYSGKSMIANIFFPIETKLGPVDIKVLEVIMGEKEKSIRKEITSLSKKSIKNVSLKLLFTPVKSFLHVEARLNKSANFISVISGIKNFLNTSKWEMNEQIFDAEISKLRTNFLKNIEKPHMFGIFNANSFAIFGIESVLSSYEGDNFKKAAKKIAALGFSDIPLVIINLPAAVKEKLTSNNGSKPQLFFDNKIGKTLITEQNPASGLVAVHLLFKNKVSLEERFGLNSSKIIHYCFEKRLKSQKNIKKSSKFGLSFKLNDNPYFPMDDIYMNPDFGYMRFEALAENYKDVVKFIMENAKNYVPGKDEFDYALKKISRSHMMKMGSVSSAKNRFSEILDKTLYTSLPRIQKKPDLNNLKEFGEIYMAPANIIISVVSPVKSDDMAAIFNPYFPNSGYSEKPPTQKLLKTPTKKISIKKDLGGNRSYLFFGFVKETDPSDFEALKALSLVLSSRITFDVREKRGMAYRMSSGIKTVGKKSLFYINMGTLPKNTDTLLKLFPGYFNARDILRIDKKELKKLISKYLGRMMFRRLSSINRAYYLAYSYYFHKDINFDLTSLKKLKQITIDDVKRVAKKYLKVENPVLINIR